MSQAAAAEALDPVSETAGATAPQANQKTNGPPRIPLTRRLAYGVGELVVGIRQATFGIILFPFYTDVVQLPPALVGAALALGRIWDGLNDPLVGWLSDRTRTRFGRRRPYLVAMALPLALTFFAIWSPPVGDTERSSFIWLVAALCLFDVFFGFYSTPYLALGAEMTSDYADRARVVATRAVFHNIGLLLGGGGFLGLAATFGGGHAGHAAAGAVFAGIMIAAALGAFFGTKEGATAPPAEAASLRALLTDLRSTLRLHSFRVLLGAFCLLLVGASINQAFSVYVFRDAFGAADRQGAVIGAYLLAATLSFPFWAWLAGKWGKNRAFEACLWWSVTALCISPFLGANLKLGAVLLFVGLSGFGAGGYVLPVAIVADIFDEDELETGQRREGSFFGVWTLVMKLASAVGIATAGLVLPALGYIPGADQQSAETLWLLKLAWGPLASFFFVLTIVVMRRFPITAHRHHQIQLALLARRDSRAQQEAGDS